MFILSGANVVDFCDQFSATRDLSSKIAPFFKMTEVDNKINSVRRVYFG